MQWDRVENKGSVVVYAGGALVLLWFSSTIVSAVNAVPLVQASSTCSGCSLCSDFLSASYWQQHCTMCHLPFQIAYAGVNPSQMSVTVAFPTMHVHARWGDKHQGQVHISIKFCIMQLPKLLEMVGLGYSAWFVYRYLLFKVMQCFCCLARKANVRAKRRLEVSASFCGWRCRSLQGHSRAQHDLRRASTIWQELAQSQATICLGVSVEL